MNFNRRQFLLFLGATTGSVISGMKRNRIQPASATVAPSVAVMTGNSNLSFEPVKLPLPLSERMPIAQQIENHANYAVRDELVLPEGFTYDLIAAWGDRVGDSRFGYNNDYLSLIETAPNEGYLTVNFEYISGGTWMQTYPLVIGKQLPFAELIAMTEPQEGKIDAFSLQDGDLKAKIVEVSREGLIDQGLGVISLKRNGEGN